MSLEWLGERPKPTPPQDRSAFQPRGFGIAAEQPNPQTGHWADSDLFDIYLERRRATLDASVMQRYVEKTYSQADKAAGGMVGAWRQSDDTTIATGADLGNHHFYAKAGKAAAANTKLEAVDSDIELTEASQTALFRPASGQALSVKLHKITATNQSNKTQGDKMERWTDCRKCTALTVGSKDQLFQGIHNMPEGVGEVRSKGTLEAIKVVIFEALASLDSTGGHQRAR